MAQLLRMPEVAAGGTTATLATWSVTENAAFSAEESLAEIETDKAIVDLAAETDGVVLKLLVAPGTQVGVGEPIGLELGPAAMPEGPDDPQALDAPTTAPPAVKPKIAGRSASTTVTAVDPLNANTEAQPTDDSRIFASPLARNLAREADLQLSHLRPGSGPNGRIRRQDVHQAIARRGETATSAIE